MSETFNCTIFSVWFFKHSKFKQNIQGHKTAPHVTKCAISHLLFITNNAGVSLQKYIHNKQNSPQDQRFLRLRWSRLRDRERAWVELIAKHHHSKRSRKSRFRMPGIGLGLRRGMSVYKAGSQLSPGVIFEQHRVEICRFFVELQVGSRDLMWLSCRDITV